MNVNLAETEYSDNFDEHRKARVATSQHKYGSAKINFGQRLVNAVETIELCLKKYRATHNTEYLCDLANYAMFEYMYPQFDDAYFQATSDRESAGISGISIKEAGAYRNEDC